jgi:spermidine synthase
MKPWITLDRAMAPDGTELVLSRRGEELVIRAAGQVLMTSRMHRSEELLAEAAIACLAGAARKRPAVLVGGLGLGHTLRAALDRLPPGATVRVIELVPAVIEWNRTFAAEASGRPLEDPRVGVESGDALHAISAAEGELDAILLDVDNGPRPLAHSGNAALYGEPGIAACRRALRTRGVLAVWSAGPDPAYRARLARGGFAAEERRVPAAESGRERHVIFVARAVPLP